MQMKIYDNFLIVGDFNSEMTESAMENFWQYSNISLADFHSEFLYWLGKHAPVKKRQIRANQKDLWTKNLNKQSWLGLSFKISF